MNDLIETPEEMSFSKIAAKLTVATLAYDEAVEAFHQYRYSHKIPTFDVRAKLDELQLEIERRGAAVQALLGPYSRAQNAKQGW